MMKMVECMEEEALICPKGETNNEITQKNQANSSSGSKGRNKCKWGQRKHRLPSDKEKSMDQNHWLRSQNGTYPRSNVLIMKTTDIW
jgi:hypothetical protein